MKRALTLSTLLALALAAAQIDGEALYTKYGCYGCHGSNAEGMSNFPKLAGKPQNYLIKKLKGYKAGTIHSNRAGTMQPFAQKLSDEEIEAIAAYLSKIKSQRERDEERYYEEFLLHDSSGS